MCLEITKGFNKNFIYITYVEKIDRSKMESLFEDYKVVGMVRFYIWNKNDKKWMLLFWDRRKFAKFLRENNINCYHGIIQCINDVYYLCKPAVVRAFIRNNDYWITTNPDYTKSNNLMNK